MVCFEIGTDKCSGFFFFFKRAFRRKDLDLVRVSSGKEARVVSWSYEDIIIRVRALSRRPFVDSSRDYCLCRIHTYAHSFSSFQSRNYKNKDAFYELPITRSNIANFIQPLLVISRCASLIAVLIASRLGLIHSNEKSTIIQTLWHQFFILGDLFWRLPRHLRDYPFLKLFNTHINQCELRILASNIHEWEVL